MDIQIKATNLSPSSSTPSNMARRSSPSIYVHFPAFYDQTSSVSETRRQHSPMSLSGKSCTSIAGAKAEDWFVYCDWEAFSTDEQSMMRVYSCFLDLD
ncbi:unnamed protein product [Lactuca saligna]|uniref:Uncharacterized protein n=1 Tax=Lactuca saligna TaxID=75948 RepID=A0AA35YK59_LACSI|nr:unnamed protein product [Lactuca saligna]CAI9275510.1 unnamed protein product [Lactuca saligna]